MHQQALRHTAALTGRSLRHVLRSPDTIVTTAVMPIAFLLLFVYVFGGAISTVALAVVVAVALVMGFRSAAGVSAWLAVAGVLLLFTLALTWLAVVAGLTASSVDGASAFSYPWCSCRS